MAFREETFPDLMRLPRPEHEVAIAKAQTRYALEYAGSHPLRELRLVPARLYHLYRHDHAAFAYLAGSTRYHAPLVPLFSVFAALALARPLSGFPFTRAFER
jgi:hypothetical protein